jgi:hypothetical protein
MRWRTLFGGGLTLVLLAGLLTQGAASAAAPGVLKVVSLSNRADLLSGGDALLEVVLPKGTSERDVTVRLDGREVTSAFARRPDGRYYGRVEKMSVGRHTVVARTRDGRGARLTLTNHPRGGPVFSGPQIQPWVCTTEAAGLGKPLNAQCDGATTYTFSYKSAVTGQFSAYDPANPPAASQIATTTIDTGRTVPYVVRDERGTLDRGVYDLAVLYDPSKPWEPWAPQAGWNHKFLFTFGSACNPGHSQAGAQDPKNDLALSRGFAVGVSSVNVFGNVCNHVVAAESVMMVKERLIERYGTIRYTMGSGCSGGSEAQNTIGENYPGLLDGILPTCTFADGWTPALMDKFDCPLLNRYFNQTSPQLWGVEPQRAAVLGGALSSAICAEADVAFSAAPWDPTTGCGIDGDPRIYNASSNPRGVRCTMQDYNANALGHRPDGFGNGVNDHVGLEWGRAALEGGTILPEQFVDLNEQIGGFDIDFRWQPGRTKGDVAGIARMYRTGQLTYGKNLAKVASIDARADDTYDFHSNVHRQVLRARMVRAVGNHHSQVYWMETNPGGFGAPLLLAEKAFDGVDRWLTAIEKDKRSIPLERKVAQDKPSDLKDGCFTLGEPQDDPAICALAESENVLPRMAAGMPLTGDVLKCQLKPLRKQDYAVTFSDAQWTRLQKAFPTGVCDFSKRDAVFRAPVADSSWLTLSTGVGGTPLPGAPQSVPFGRSTLPRLPTPGGLAATGGAATLSAAGALLLLLGLAVRRRREASAH